MSATMADVEHQRTGAGADQGMVAVHMPVEAICTTVISRPLYAQLPGLKVRVQSQPKPVASRAFYVELCSDRKHSKATP